MKAYEQKIKTEKEISKDLKTILGDKLYKLICTVGRTRICGSYLLNKVNDKIPFNDIDIYVSESIIEILQSSYEDYGIDYIYVDGDLAYFDKNGKKINLLNNEKYDVYDIDWDVIKLYGYFYNEKCNLSNYNDCFNNIEKLRIETMNINKLSVKSLYRMLKYKEKGFKFSKQLENVIVAYHNHYFYEKLIDSRNRGFGEARSITNVEDLVSFICENENLMYENSFIEDMPENYQKYGLELIRGSLGRKFLEDLNIKTIGDDVE